MRVSPSAFRKVAAVVVLFASSCGTDDGSTVVKQVVDKSANIAKAEDELLSRRDVLVKARQRIRDERRKLDEQRRAAVAAGGDTSQIDKAQAKLVSEERGLLGEESAINERVRAIIRERRALVETLASSGGIPAPSAAAREQSVAAREQSVAAREQALAARAGRLATREAELAAREQAFAKREAQLCGVASQPATIIRTVDAKGSSYTKRDVEPLLARARTEMSKRGLRRSDLPGPARDLEKEATAAMSEGDYGRARFAASQLVGTVRSIKVNKAFIQAKIGRLNGAIRGKKLAPRVRTQVDALFRQATSSYGDGKFRRANRRLNKIYSMIEK